MGATNLHAGFRIDDWLVEPLEKRITGANGIWPLTDAQSEILLCLAEQHGEAVSRSTLRRRGWPDGDGDDAALRENLRALQRSLGDAPDAPRLILPAGPDGYALVGHVAPVNGGSTGTPGPSSPSKAYAPQFASRLLSAIDELRRRHVLKVAVAYLVAAWLVLQVAETTFEPLHLPPWWLTALTILSVIGFPVVTVLAWLYDITPAGIVADVSGSGIALPRPRRSLAPWIVTGVAVMAAVTGLAWWRSLQQATDAGQQGRPAFASIAVLPLVDMNPSGADGAYLGDGLSEELSARLAQVPGLRVAARTSAFRFKGRDIDVRQIGRELGVRHVIEGSIRRAGDGLRITVQLIDAEDGYHVWSQNYDRGVRDLLEMQAEIAAAVTDALKLVLAPGDNAERPGPDTRAIEPYLAGLALLGQSGDLGQLRNAMSHFDEALTVDPNFARAHAGICKVGVRIYGRTRDPADLANAERHCNRALDLDATLVETEKALGGLYNSGGRYGAAASIFRALLARTPEDADGYIGLGRSLEGLGRIAEAEKELHRAVEAEPRFWGTHNALGAFLLAQGRVGEAASAFARVTELTPASASAYSNLGAALLSAGEFERASTAFIGSLEIAPSNSAYSNLGSTYFYRSQFAQAADNYRRAVELAGENLTMWGNLADALWQIPDRRGEAVVHYRRAIALGERDLGLAPDDALVEAQLGYYYGRTGDAARSREHLDRVLRLGVEAPNEATYYAALAAADAGDRTRAAALIHDAIRAGYPSALAQADPALKGVRLRDAQGVDASREQARR